MLRHQKSILIGLSVFMTFPLCIEAASRSIDRTFTMTQFGALPSTTTTIYDGPRSRREFEGNAGITLFAGSYHRIDIERPDLNKRYELDPKRRRYTEEPIKLGEKEQKEMEEATEAMKKGPPPEAKEKGEDVHIKVDVKVNGPGTPVTLNGFRCRPYEIITTQTFHSTKKPEEKMTQVYYQKIWTSEDPILKNWEQAQMDNLKAVGEAQGINPESTEKFQKEFMEMMKNAKAKGDPGGQWMKDTADAWAKVKGYPVRTAYAMTIKGIEGKTSPATTTTSSIPEPEPDRSREEAAVGVDDFSGGMQGAVSGIASRWMRRKAEKKVEEKIEEKMPRGDPHPAWLADIEKALGGPVMGATMNEVLAVGSIKPDPALFEVPAGYKRVKSL